MAASLSNEGKTVVDLARDPAKFSPEISRHFLRRIATFVDDRNSGEFHYGDAPIDDSPDNESFQYREIEIDVSRNRYFASRESHEIHCRSRLKDAGNCSKMWPRWSGK